jgi:hypothetical protein
MQGANWAKNAKKSHNSGRQINDKRALVRMVKMKAKRTVKWK